MAKVADEFMHRILLGKKQDNKRVTKAAMLIVVQIRAYKEAAETAQQLSDHIQKRIKRLEKQGGNKRRIRRLEKQDDAQVEIIQDFQKRILKLELKLEDDGFLK